MRASSDKIIYSNPTSDILRSVKTTAYDQNNNIQWYFHILKAQKSSRNDSVWFVTSLHWINPHLHWITLKLHLSYYHIKQIDFMLSRVGLLSNRSHKLPNVRRTSVLHLAAPYWFLPPFDVICALNYARQHGIWDRLAVLL